MAKRYIGDAVINIEYVGSRGGKDEYAGTIHAGGKTWKFDELYAAPAGFGRGVAYDSPKAYDEMAKSAASFGSYYSHGNRGDDTPDWAPPEEVADAIDEAVSWAQDDRGEYEVRRSPSGQAREMQAKRSGASATAKPDQRAVDFFLKHAGYGYGPGETPEQGRRRGAIALAKAEQEATARGWRVKWEEDPDGWDTLGDIDPDDVKEILVAVLYDEDGNVLGSLGGIVNPDHAYSRVVEAELALEALPSEGVAHEHVREVSRRRHGMRLDMKWTQSAGGTGWRGTDSLGRTYLLRRAGARHWNLHIEGRQYGPFDSLADAKREAGAHANGNR